MLPDVPDFDIYAIDHLPEKLIVAEQRLIITWDDGKISHYPFVWLREYSPDAGTFNDITREQNIAVTDLPDKLNISSTEIGADGSVIVNWQPENLDSRYHPGWLRAHCPSNPKPNFELPKRTLWTATRTAASQTFPPTFSGAQIDTDKEFSEWLGALHSSGVAVITDLPIAPEALEKVVDRIGPIRTSNFGRIFDVELKAETNSNAYTSQPLRAHTDLATREYQPGLQFFFCMENSVSGGETILTDGLAVAEKIRTDHPDEYAFLTEQPIPFVNTDRDSEYRYEVPILETDHHGDITTVRFTYWLRAPMTGDLATLDNLYSALRLFHHYADHEDYQLRFPLKPGDLIGVDNRRVLHGRTGFAPDAGHRWLRGCYMEREELESRLRVLDRQRRIRSA
ncbi:MAG: DUF971 domain-containing protein [Gammaproteobacteria bacterium]|nr:DUF971 domain-containing protein [Gammaproteobacteria bacterium]